MKRKNIVAFEPVGRIMEETGALRVSHDAKVTMADYITEYALDIGKLAIKYAEHAKRTTVTAKDIKLAQKNL